MFVLRFNFVITAEYFTLIAFYALQTRANKFCIYVMCTGVNDLMPKRDCC